MSTYSTDASHPDTGSDSDPLLSPRELATQENITKGWLDKARCRGDGPPFFRVGGRIYYRRSEYHAWLDGHRHTSTSTY